MTYQIKLKDLRQFDDMYYIGDIVDVDGSGWVTKQEAEQLIDMINAEVNQPIIDNWSEDNLLDDYDF